MHPAQHLQKYERRGKFVTDEERDKWQEITPQMMSDEEEVDGKFKVHRPEWRSIALNDYLKALDSRANASDTASGHPRKERIVGTPIKCQIPACLGSTSWMVEDELSD